MFREMALGTRTKAIDVENSRHQLSKDFHVPTVEADTQVKPSYLLRKLSGKHLAKYFLPEPS